MNYPIPEHPTWKKNDSSKLMLGMDCFRQYFFEYVLGWRSTAPNNHLVFGSSIHKAMEYLLLNGYEDLSVLRAYESFLHEYRKSFPEDMDDMFAPKTPMMALRALGLYAEQYRSDLSEFDVLYTETSGVVLLAEDSEFYFKMDNILKDREGMIFSLEHKTGSQLSSKWDDKFMLSTQIGTYTHVMYCMYPPEQVKGVKVNGIFFYKSKPPQFHRVPVWKTKDQMTVWLWNTLWWLDEIKYNFELLKTQTDSQRVMECFPMNTENCTKYFGCPYLDFCTAWPNPLQKVGEPPMGFKIDFWDPTQEETTHRIEVK